jgi:hypothetical protein
MRHTGPEGNIFPLHTARIDQNAQSLETLERRLDDGYARIERARSLGQDISAWEDFWIDLLHQYELACSELPEAA